ncbi:hypothetical protein [Rhodococcus sp. B50]|uniref:hypothetical protein n=1 Tax=Rhodococcus sp. B50 TaxID=2682847 RepID=UPI0019F2DD90|nr:hypothetical protein [Rhodococcus sp. B50]MBS9371577.1 hypothetical protein [Rhodococcus sp. B50]
MDIQVGAHGEFTPHVYAIPERKNAQGETEEVNIVVHPTGLPDGNSIRRINVRLGYTMDEAEKLARLILKAVENARAGKFDEIGTQLAADLVAEDSA